MRIATVEQMREMDRIAIKERGVPSTELMERAAQAVAGAAMELMRPGCASGKERAYLPTATGSILMDGQTADYERNVQDRPRRAVVFCGAGNNGGDGVAAARLLLEQGVEARAILVGRRDKLTPDCREMERRLIQAGGALEDFKPDDAEFAAWCLSADVMVDAIFGVGLNTELKGDPLTAVHMMNTCEVPVVSADIASGVEADTGRILGAAVQAEATVTFTLPKTGHFLGKGGLCCGRLSVADIGIPRDLMERAGGQLQAVTACDVCLPRRKRDAHKGDFGKVCILGGSVGYTGAPVFAARAAVRTGSGQVSVGVPLPAWPIAAQKLAEAMPFPLAAGKDGTLSLESTEAALAKIAVCGVCLIGPGLGRGNGVYAVVRHILQETRVPVVLDADGINALEGHIDSLDGRRGLLTVLTPHDGEFTRLTGAAPGEDRLAAARDFAVAHGCCMVLKGHRTITAFPDGNVYINTTGNPGMAKGGSGDVLGGMILSLLGQGFSAREAVPMAVYLHGRAGDMCAKKLGEYSMTPTDMVEALPQVLLEVTAGR